MVKSEGGAPDQASDFLISFAPGEVIFRKGETGEEMFIIQEGTVEILYQFGPQEKRAAVLEAGDFFGEMSVLEDLPRGATAKAVEACRLLPVNAEALDEMLRNHPELLLRMLRKLASRQRRQEEEAQRAQQVAAGVLAGAEVPTAPVAAEPQQAKVAEAPLEIRLVHKASGSSFQLDPDKRNLVGRHDPVTQTVPEADLSSVDSKRTLSRRHARIWYEDGAVFLQEEMGAANGTFVDNRRLAPGQSQAIENGSRLRFGLVEVVVEIENEA